MIFFFFYDLLFTFAIYFVIKFYIFFKFYEIARLRNVYRIQWSNSFFLPFQIFYFPVCKYFPVHARLEMQQTPLFLSFSFFFTGNFLLLSLSLGIPPNIQETRLFSSADDKKRSGVEFIPH